MTGTIDGTRAARDRTCTRWSTATRTRGAILETTTTTVVEEEEDEEEGSSRIIENRGSRCERRSGPCDPVARSSTMPRHPRWRYASRPRRNTRPRPTPRRSHRGPRACAAPPPSGEVEEGAGGASRCTIRGPGPRHIARGASRVGGGVGEVRGGGRGGRGGEYQDRCQEEIRMVGMAGGRVAREL